MATPTRTPPTASASTSNHQYGIHIEDAFSILLARSKHGGEKIQFPLRSNEIPHELRGMGQTIDIANQLEIMKQQGCLKCDCTNGDGDFSADMSDRNLEEDEKYEAVKEERLKRGVEIQSRVQSMDVSDLLGALFGAQQERVATYKMFEK